MGEIASYAASLASSPISSFLYSHLTDYPLRGYEAGDFVQPSSHYKPSYDFVELDCPGAITKCAGSSEMTQPNSHGKNGNTVKSWQRQQHKQDEEHADASQQEKQDASDQKCDDDIDSTHQTVNGKEDARSVEDSHTNVREAVTAKDVCYPTQQNNIGEEFTESNAYSHRTQQNVKVQESQKQVPPTRNKILRSAISYVRQGKKEKKRVGFADNVGEPLTEVREFSESSYEPPQECTKLCLVLNQLALAESKRKGRPHLYLMFTQPAANYLAFRRRLEESNVALENVLVRGDEISGTIKVTNIAFHKAVFVRWTVDDWKSVTNTYAEYTPISCADVHLPFDTFKFYLCKALEPPATKMQFAVAFVCNDKMYWDNRDGRNYCIVRENFFEAKLCPPDVFGLPPDTDEWSNFCPWRDLSNHGPYW